MRSGVCVCCANSSKWSIQSDGDKVDNPFPEQFELRAVYLSPTLAAIILDSLGRSGIPINI